MSFESRYRKQIEDDLDKIFYELFHNNHEKMMGVRQIEVACVFLLKNFDPLYNIVSHNWTLNPDGAKEKKDLKVYREELRAAYNTMVLAQKKPNVEVRASQTIGVHLCFNKKGRIQWRIACNIRVDKINTFVTHFIIGLKNMRCPKCNSKLNDKFICTICHHVVDFEFKTWAYNNCNIEGLLRRDKVVIYLPDESLIPNLFSILGKLKKYFDPDTPYLLKKLFPGCGYGHEHPTEQAAVTEEEAKELHLASTFNSRFCLIILRHLQDHLHEICDVLKKRFLDTKDEKGLYKFLKPVFDRVKIDVINDRHVKQYIKTVAKVHSELKHLV